MQSNDCLFPAGSPALKTPHALDLPLHIHGGDFFDLDIEPALYRFLDLYFIGVPGNLKSYLALGLLQTRDFLCDQRPDQYLSVRFQFPNTSFILVNAPF